MLLCPKCQFENPNTNNFCQRCGTSLTHKTCQECGTQVPLNAETCQNCGEPTGTVWYAIISKVPDSLPFKTAFQGASLEGSKLVIGDKAQADVSHKAVKGELPQPETSPVITPVPSSASSPPQIEAEESEADTPPALVPAPIEGSLDQKVAQPLSNQLRTSSCESANEDKSKGETSSPMPSVVYLDYQQRYQLLELQSLEQLAAGAEARYGVAVRVLDCQPFQKSPLEALMEQKKGESDKFERSGSGSSSEPSDSWKVLGIPALAQPYLALKESYYPLPKIHDAWDQDGEAVVLLEDRTGWPLLSDLWGSEDLSSLQILYWLDEMAKLWEALEPWHCRQSLLEITNLRVDEDQALGLVRLYPESREQPLTLQDLGQTWQLLFNQSQRTQFTALGAIFRQLCTNEIRTISEVRSHLEKIAHEQQCSPPIADQSYGSPEPIPPDPTEPIELDTQPVQVPTKPPLDDDIDNPSEPDEFPTVILPMELLSLDDAGCTDIGKQREHNEDYFGIYTQIKKQENPIRRSVQARGLYILCDGMGGHAAGEVASAMAVETLKRYFQDNWHDQLPTEDCVREAVHLANQVIYDINQQNARSGSGRMGTTLVMMLIQNTEAVIAHVGDSRVYRLTRKRGLEQVTVDHEVGQREINRGVDPEIAYKRPDAYQLTQALGPRSEQFVNPDVQFLELNEDSLFVLCSDGLSDNSLIETHWQTCLAPLVSARANLDQGILQLIDLANEHNGHDNITAILIRVKVRPNLDQQRLF